ncbi:hypothetical protein BD413DRAFT_721648 [Trametes elegans]|nr:hypothetical protein BD413DRAFT_721648 [Trametes elegans]
MIQYPSDSKHTHHGFPSATADDAAILQAGTAYDDAPPAYDNIAGSSSLGDGTGYSLTTADGQQHLPSVNIPSQATGSGSGASYSPGPTYSGGSSSSTSSPTTHRSPSIFSAPSTENASSSTSRADSSAHPPSTHSGHSPPSTPLAQTLLNSPPPSFERRPPADLPYGPFPPTTLLAHSADLTRGFPHTPPTCPCPPPHPFLTHDVNEADWARFLDDVTAAGGLKPVNTLLADAAPTVGLVGLVAGYLASAALRAHVKSKRKSPVADVIDLWNRRFFHPRSMDVVLAQGYLTYTGPVDAAPPDMIRPVFSSAGAHDKHVAVIHDHSDDEEDTTSPRRLRVATAMREDAAVGGHLGLGPGRGRERSVGKGEPGVGRRGGLGAGRRGGLGAGRRGGLGAGRRGGLGVGRTRTGRDFSVDLKMSVSERWRIVVQYKPPVL